MRFSRKLTGDMQGFSLLEMLVVVGIMATLSAIGIPKYNTFMASARQSEAKNNLSHIYTLEQTYLGDNENYVALPRVGPGTGGSCAANTLNFKLAPCSTTYSDKVRYGYEAVTAAANQEFKARATAGDGTADQNFVSNAPAIDDWRIDHNKNLCAFKDTANDRNESAAPCDAWP